MAFLGFSSVSQGLQDERHVVVSRNAEGKGEKVQSALNEAARKRFVKDFDLPIQIFTSPLFEYYLDLYDKDFQTQSKYASLLEALSVLGGESRLAKESARIKDSILADIKATKGFEHFSTVSEDNYKVNHTSNHTWSGSDVYKQPNATKIFISIDLTSANFNSLRKVIGPEIVLGATSWNELISRYTTLPYFKLSKAFRQLIFGNLNPNKQKVLITYICHGLLDRLLPTFLGARVTNVLADEIVIESTLPGLNADLEAISNALKSSEFFDIVHVETFRLVCITPRSYFVKEIFKLADFKADTDIVAKVSYKCIPAVFFAQAFKVLFLLS